MIEKRIELDQYLFEPNRNYITVEQIIEKLEELERFFKFRKESNNFIMESALMMDQQSIAREEVGFNVVRNKINNMIKSE